jgi:hypothetical protein
MIFNLTKRKSHPNLYHILCFPTTYHSFILHGALVVVPNPVELLANTFASRSFSITIPMAQPFQIPGPAYYPQKKIPAPSNTGTHVQTLKVVAA